MYRLFIYSILTCCTMTPSVWNFSAVPKFSHMNFCFLLKVSEIGDMNTKGLIKLGRVSCLKQRLVEIP